MLTERRRYWRLLIEAKRELNGADIDLVSTLVRERADANCRDNIVSPDQSIGVTIEELANGDRWFNGVFAELERKGERGWGECGEGTSSSGERGYCRPILVEVLPFKRIDDGKRILGDISDAHGQLQGGELGVVHIEIPYREAKRLLEITDRSYQRIFGLLRNKNRISCAVLSARTLVKLDFEGKNPITDYSAVVPNPAPSRALPHNFVVMGACETPMASSKTGNAGWMKNVLLSIRWFLFITPLKWADFNHPFKRLDRILEGAEGSAYFEFGIHQPLSEQTGRYLFNYCSRDGRRQLKLWQSLSGEFRLDVVSVAFGRRTYSTDLNDLQVGTLHKLAVSWSKDGPTAVLDGMHIFKPDTSAGCLLI